MNVPLIIVQARLDSSRLPRKVLLPLGPKKVLEHLFFRLRALRSPARTLLATSDKPGDLPLVRWAQHHSISYFRGSKENVLERFYKAALKYQAKVIVRITADCPLVQPALIDEMLVRFNQSACDYLSNTLLRTFPKGFDCEIFTFTALEKAYQSAQTDYQKEHVTPYFYQNPESFHLENFSTSTDYSHLRVCLDTQEDYAYLKALFETYYPKNSLFGIEEILKMPLLK